MKEQKELVLYGFLLSFLMGAVSQWLLVILYAAVIFLKVPPVVSPVLIVAYYAGVLYWVLKGELNKWRINKYVFLIIPFTFIITRWIHTLMHPLSDLSELYITSVNYLTTASNLCLMLFELVIVIVFIRMSKSTESETCADKQNHDSKIIK